MTAPPKVPGTQRRAHAGAEPEAEPGALRFSPEQEEALLEEANALRAKANAFYSAGGYDDALSTYKDALATCPNYLHYERAVLRSNMAACHLQREQWKEAIEAATGALDGLAALEKVEAERELAGGAQDGEAERKRTEEAEGKRTEKAERKRTEEAEGKRTEEAEGKRTEKAERKRTEEAEGKRTEEAERKRTEEAEDSVQEEDVISAGAAPGPSSQTDASAAETRKADVRRIRAKALLRRARARAEAGGWQGLAGAEEDYKALSGMPGLGAADRRTVRQQLAVLPGRTKAAQEREMAEMWGKLRTLGDGILRPFGLSTSNFQMARDDKSGGYSMNFTSGKE